MCLGTGCSLECQRYNKHTNSQKKNYDCKWQQKMQKKRNSLPTTLVSAPYQTAASNSYLKIAIPH